MTSDARRAAELAATELFTNGRGEVADRLVLTSAAGHDLGGWCYRFAVDEIESAIEKVVSSPSVFATVTLRCTSRDAAGVTCGRTATYSDTRTGVDVFAEARHDGWAMFRDAARCRACGNAAASFGPPC